MLSKVLGLMPERVAFDDARDAYVPRAAVADRVGRQFPYDVQYRVGRLVGEPLARHVEANGKLRFANVRDERPPDGFVHARFVERVVAEVPQAVLEFLSA